MTTKPKVNCFEPRPLANDVDLKDVRASMFGAAFKDMGYDKLPDSDLCKILWEVPCSRHSHCLSWFSSIIAS